MKSKSILLVEDNPQDEMLILRALKKANVANVIDVVRDGQQAFDFAEFAETVARLGVYWIAINEPSGKKR